MGLCQKLRWLLVRFLELPYRKVDKISQPKALDTRLGDAKAFFARNISLDVMRYSCGERKVREMQFRQVRLGALFWRAPAFLS